MQQYIWLFCSACGERRMHKVLEKEQFVLKVCIACEAKGLFQEVRHQTLIQTIWTKFRNVVSITEGV